MNRSSSFVLYLFLISTIITADQATKRWALTNLNADLPVNGWCNLSLSANRGVSWGLFNFQSNFGFYILTSIISIVILAFALYAVIQHLNKISIHFESFIIGGAISNVIDRLTHGFVIDFLDIHMGIWHWPTFNIADVFVVIGVLGVLLKELRKNHD
ncbi:MAG: signal peptidase II [Candidatus Babeliales bacterium]|jgi:signal peptidase II